MAQPQIETLIRLGHPVKSTLSQRERQLETIRGGGRPHTTERQVGGREQRELAPARASSSLHPVVKTNPNVTVRYILSSEILSSRVHELVSS